jgi:ADP-ribosylglycohydrolase
MWQQSSRSRVWSIVPETEEQADFVRDWAAAGRGAAPPQRVKPDDSQDRARGALLGLAIGDLAGAAVAGDPGGWTQHTAMTLCLAESLLSAGRMDARDQMAQYLRWRDEGYLSARGSAAGLTDDVSRALATYQWRGQPMAGSHDPTDLKTSSLPRVVAAVLFAAGDPVAGVALAGECSRTTNQAPVVIDACRFFAALLFGALRGVPAARLFEGLYEPVPGLWRDRPLKDELLAALTGERVAAIRGRKQEPNVLQALVIVRESVIETKSIDAAVRAATRVGSTPALTGALAGALAGALLGAKSIPPKRLKELPRLDLIESVLQRLANRAPNAQAAGPSGGPV